MALGGTPIAKEGANWVLAKNADVTYDRRIEGLNAAKAVTNFTNVFNFNNNSAEAIGSLFDSTITVSVTSGKLNLTVPAPKEANLQPLVVAGTPIFGNKAIVTPVTAKYFGSENTPAVLTNISGIPNATVGNSQYMYGLVCGRDDTHLVGITYISEAASVKGVELENSDGGITIFDITTDAAGWYYIFYTYTGTGFQNMLITASKNLPSNYKWMVVDKHFFDDVLGPMNN